MFSIGLIGIDGAGKTTIAKSLLNSLPFKVKYVYMGLATQSSNFVLPTSYLVHLLKLRTYRKSINEASDSLPTAIPDYRNAYVNKRVQNTLLWKIGRFFNRVAEAWYRQAICMVYRFRGFVVICDRHFLFDMVPDSIDSHIRKGKRLDWLFYWMLSHLYPKPHLFIFLDVPAEIAFARNPELTPYQLNERRKAILHKGKKLNNFVRVNAARPLCKVKEDVKDHILSIHAFKKSKEANNIDLH